jgi:ADP-ribosylation factor-like protein 6
MGLWERLFGFGKNRELSFVVIGLDNAGKTSVLNWAKPESRRQELRKIQPTIGYEVEQFEFEDVKLTAMDMAGQAKYRDMWTSRLDEAHAVVFVVDSSDAMRLCVAKEELQRVLLSDLMKSRKIPLLFFANKSDIPKAANTASVMRELSLDLITDRPWKLLASDAIRGVGVEEGFLWLVEAAKEFKKKSP